MSWTDDIIEKVGRRIPELAEMDNEDFCVDLITDAYTSIMRYTNANSYQKEWDSKLVRCVCMLYNNVGTEGSTSRQSIGVVDTYDTTDIIGGFIQMNFPQYIRPVGFKYNEKRFELPK